MVIARRRLTEAQKRIVAAAFRWTCADCEAVLTSTYHIDHIVPLWEGGADSVDNCQPLCVACHAIKTQVEGILRAERKRRLLRRCGATTRSPVECLGCGVIFSPHFSHRCAGALRVPL